MPIQNRTNADHYRWGEVCDGWRLLDCDYLSVIEEQMPSGATEIMHVHDKSNQLFFLLSGNLIIEIDGVIEQLSPGDSLHVRPGLPHQVRNESKSDDARFLVISAPTTRGDRRSV